MEGILNALKERFSNVLAFSIAVSWLLCNYEFLIVMFSGGSAMEKIQLINNQLYDGFPSKLINWIFLPLFGGCLYTFGYPLLDVKISRFLEGVKIKKEREIFEISRTIPVAAERQYEYFSEYDQKIEYYKKRLDKAIEHRNHEMGEKNKIIQDLEASNKSYVLKVFCLGTTIQPYNLPWLVEYDAGTYSENDSDYENSYIAFVGRKEFPALLKLAKQARYVGINFEEYRLVDAEWIKDQYEGANEQVRVEFMDLVLALGLVVKHHNSFDIQLAKMENIIRIYDFVQKRASE